MNTTTSPPPSPETGDRFLTRHGEYADMAGVGGLHGYYTQDLATIGTGERVGLYDDHLGRAVIGVVRDALHEAGCVTFRFEEERFRVLHGTEPVMADWRTYRWHSPATAGNVHAVLLASDTASAPYTHRYNPAPGTSLAFTDVTGHGGPGEEWLYGTPYHENYGDLVPWCQHCGQPMTASSSPGEKGPYFDIAEGEDPPACQDGRAHYPVYIWTPYGHACATPCQNLRLTNDYRARDGKPPLDPFNASHTDEALTFPVSSTPEWLDAALYGREFVDDIMQGAVVRPAHQLADDPAFAGGVPYCEEAPEPTPKKKPPRPKLMDVPEIAEASRGRIAEDYEDNSGDEDDAATAEADWMD
ncbi:hypothetical protein ACIRQF_31345 [Streptomyces sp. NPDC101191]|uniref:hypothetical protein n=1 Tax=Streptomyces sp. NPDC101191 TaxID=3366126 RepID=UPI0037FF6267